MTQRHGQMGCMVLCRTFHTAPEQGQGLTPIVPYGSGSVMVPVPVPDTAKVIKPFRIAIEMSTFSYCD